MNWLPWILVVAMGYEVQCQGNSNRRGRGHYQQRGFPSLFCFHNSRIYMAGQSFPSSDGCNTCTCSGRNRVTCTERACLPNPPKDVCQLPSVTGRCRAFIPSWYYDYKEKKCKQFIYGGCGGNANRFRTQDECQQRCGEEPVCKGRKQLPNRQCGRLMGRPCPRNYECVGQLLPVDGPGVCCRKDPEPVCKGRKQLPNRLCGGLMGRPCPRKYACVGQLLPVDGPGVCCHKDPEPVCKGRKQLPNRQCGGLMGRPCPRNYECVGQLLPVDGPGVCCRKDSEPVCKGRKQLPNRQCGGLMGKPCPRNYECVGQLVPVDGLGVCCRKDPAPSPSNLVCPTLASNTAGICVELCSSKSDCPRGQLCCSNGCGHACMDGVTQTHPQCPRLNPLVAARCIRFEQCPRQGCPGRQECCPSYCGTTCRALSGPCGINPPLADSSGSQLFCGRGPNRVDCPQDHYCDIHPTDRYAVCCPYI